MICSHSRRFIDTVLGQVTLHEVTVQPADRERYAPDADPKRLVHLAAAEEQAREQRIGLWSANEPIPPWVWRRRNR